MFMRPPRAPFIYLLSLLLVAGASAPLVAQDIRGVDSDDLVGGAGTLSEQPVRRQHRPRKDKQLAPANSQSSQQSQASGRQSRETERATRASVRPAKRKTAETARRETARASIQSETPIPMPP